MAGHVHARPVRGFVVTVLAVLIFAPAGCDQGPPEIIRTLQQERDAVARENDQLKRQLLERDATIDDLERQSETLLGQGPGWLDSLFVVDRIELASLTGGAEYDDIPGDDGITVYIRPLDADGNVLKAAGEITVELLDTSVPGNPRTLGHYVHNDPEQLRKLWHGGLLTDHYTVKCPWSPGIGPPPTRRVLVNVTFYDFLTGRRFYKAKEVEVALPSRERAARR